MASNSELFRKFDEDLRKAAVKSQAGKEKPVDPKASTKYSGVYITKFHDQVDYWK